MASRPDKSLYANDANLIANRSVRSDAVSGHEPGRFLCDCTPVCYRGDHKQIRSLASARDDKGYSYRNACIGSTRDARSAGMSPAPNATSVSSTAAEAMTNGSQPLSS